ncbi:uncharacterized protein BO72DRAFT_196537 [Aspergillus fijiensis CBS 313.89]|uniref:Uncharacterized protein n=1 Tax=Aspergillus fijiensis CBS 313.89 TaxID=1448319 RepID=A0A8G1VWU1_9EURO|nr:uncharacterized protein BO72DRAFT_196537 [Aspergillus fijiensis CBS 313.89]RAK74628.1 hypothetical protein BO72DRAFT_196537 [Aspergillus fijiensis CBS 313.89]
MQWVLSLPVISGIKPVFSPIPICDLCDRPFSHRFIFPPLDRDSALMHEKMKYGVRSIRTIFKYSVG